MKTCMPHVFALPAPWMVRLQRAPNSSIAMAEKWDLGGTEPFYTARRYAYAGRNQELAMCSVSLWMLPC